MEIPQWRKLLHPVQLIKLTMVIYRRAWCVGLLVIRYAAWINSEYLARERIADEVQMYLPGLDI